MIKIIWSDIKEFWEDFGSTVSGVIGWFIWGWMCVGWLDVVCPQPNMIQFLLGLLLLILPLIIAGLVYWSKSAYKRSKS